MTKIQKFLTVKDEISMQGAHPIISIRLFMLLFFKLNISIPVLNDGSSLELLPPILKGPLLVNSQITAHAQTCPTH